MSKMRISGEGYRQSAVFDEQCLHLLNEEGITPETCIEWLKMARTVETTCILIKEEATVVLRNMLENKGKTP